MLAVCPQASVTLPEQSLIEGLKSAPELMLAAAAAAVLADVWQWRVLLTFSEASVTAFLAYYYPAFPTGHSVHSPHQCH